VLNVAELCELSIGLVYQVDLQVLFLSKLPSAHHPQRQKQIHNLVVTNESVFIAQSAQRLPIGFQFV
jgi:hypothetical protein